MADFSFVHDPQTDGWIISATERAKRPNVAKGTMPACPFCPAQIKKEESVYEVHDPQSSDQASWVIKVIKNKFPFAPIHEVIVLSTEHNKNLDLFSFHQIELIVNTYRERFRTYEADGQVYIFHNHGSTAGESIPHAHSQLVVIPPEITLSIPPPINTHVLPISSYQETDHFIIHCPRTAVWSDEVWVTPKKEGKVFGEILDDEASDFAFVLSRLIKIFKLRYDYDFPYNFYMYPGSNWYFRLIPRRKTLGGFEVGTGVFVNTQDPFGTIAFIREHFMTPDAEKIRRSYQAEYHEKV